MDISGLIITLIIIAGAGFGFYRLYSLFQARRKRVEIEGKEYSLISISVPKENEKTPEAAESMFAALHGIYQTGKELPAGAEQEHISFEIVAHGEEIKFYCYMPSYLKDFVEGQIYAQYPEIEIREVKDYSEPIIRELFTENGEPITGKERSVASTELVLEKPEFYPLKTFENFDVDPLASITGVLGKIGPEEDIWFQLMVRPENDAWQNRGIAYVEAIKAGQDPDQSFLKIVRKGITGLIKDLLKSAFSPPTEGKKATEEEVELSGPVQAAMEGVEEKVVKLGFETKIRLVAIAPDKVRARNRLQSAVGAFKQFNTQNMNGFAATTIKYDDGKDLNDYINRLYQGRGYILNIEELASIYHLPNLSVKTPNMIWAGSKKGEPPANLPIAKEKSEKNLTPFAKTDFRGKMEKFGLWQDDFRRHMYLIGKTGTGKTTCLQNMAIDKIRKGQGVGIIDPHGDFIETILHFIPDDRINDVILVDPSDKEHPIAFNPLENVDEGLKDIVCSGLVGIFKKIWAESWGPRLEHILRNTIMALLEYPGATMLGIPKMLVDQNFRERVIEKIKDPVVKDFWINEYGKYDQRFRTEAIAPIQNKVGQFLSASTVRNILGQPRSTINFEDIMDNRKILLMDLSKGKIGEDASALMGAMLITKIQLTAMRRTYIPEDERVDFNLFVDEFQNFATESFATILSEARKYHLSLIMANQYIAQMEEMVRESIFGNVGTLISFRVGPSDAPYLAKEFMPTFEETDLINLDKFQIYVKMAIGGVTSPPFSAKTLAPYVNQTNNLQEIIEASREKYTRPKEKVEKSITDWDQKVGQSKEEETEKRLNRKKAVYQGKSYQAKVGTDGRIWYFKEKSEKKNVKPNQKLLREHLRKLKEKQTLPSSKSERTDNPRLGKDKNGNQIIEEGKKIKLKEDNSN